MMDEALFQSISSRMARTWNMEVVSVEPGHVKVSMKLEDPRLINDLGIPFGGVLYLLADSTAGLCYISSGSYGPTVSGNLNFERGTTDKLLYAEARVTKGGHRMSFLESVLTDSTGTEIARGQFVFCPR